MFDFQFYPRMRIQVFISMLLFLVYYPLFVVTEQWQQFISCYFVSLCSMLPDTLLTCHMYAQFISLYRQLLTEVIMDEGRDSQVAGNCWLYGAYAITKPLARVSAFFPVLTMRETSVLISNCDIVEVFKRNISISTLILLEIDCVSCFRIYYGSCDIYIPQNSLYQWRHRCSQGKHVPISPAINHSKGSKHFGEKVQDYKAKRQF